ncbi:MAG TPA: ATP synthase F1 subunit epsilon [Bryobacteraceae bacterium]|nr:ATP synthase F1 subunit epsilon [Bryobacteraceae bacterium]
MAGTFQLEVATPERLLVRETVSEAQIPAINGMIGVLPDHAALLSELGTGDLSYVGPGGRHTAFIAGGFVQILNNEVRVLADRAEHVNEIDTQRAEASLKRAQERLALPATAGIDVARALNALKRAEARLAAARLGQSTGRH